MAALPGHHARNLAAATLSVAFSALVPLPFLREHVRPVSPSGHSLSVLTLWPDSQTDAVPAHRAKSKEARSRPVESSGPRTAGAEAADGTTTREVLVEPIHETSAAAVAPSTAASSGALEPRDLRLGHDVIKKAIEAGKSDFRTMAEASGAYTGDPPVSRQETLAHGVARSGKPDCLRPGGDLLSIIVIAYELAADKCVKR